MRVTRLAIAVACVVWGAALAGQGLGDSLHRRAVKDLAPGKLLVAARQLPDPNFADTVVLLADYSETGAMGLIVNRPTTVAVARVFPELGLTVASASPVFAGGPVRAPGALALLRAATAEDRARRLVGDVHLVSARGALEALIAAGAPASRLRVFLGYAGWGAGQLDEETANGVWRVLDGDADIVFDAEPRTLWERQIRRTEVRSARQSPPGGLSPAAEAPAPR